MKLRTQLSLAIALTVLLVVGIISLTSNTFISKQFHNYKKNQQEKDISEIKKTIADQYNSNSKSWNYNYLHAIGMNAMKNGYIVSVKDSNGKIIWDAQSCDMMGCHQIMKNIENTMKERDPGFKGRYTVKDFNITNSDGSKAKIVIKYYSPFFLTDYDFDFLNALNNILIIVGIVSLLIAILIGIIIARYLSRPILNAIKVTKQISDGNMAARINEKTSTKEVVELIESVNHMARTIEEQEGLRKQLTADVAHELRTPLTTLQTHLEAMADGLWEPTRERMISCNEEILRISKLVADLENLAKTESEILRLNKEKCQIGLIVQKAEAILQEQIVNKKISININGECVALIDENRIMQVILNLLSNAVKYTQENGNVEVLLSNDEGYAVIKVKDNGVGISEEDVPFIFERFYRSDKSRNYSTGGSGIGLAILKAIVEAHKGTVQVKSQLGKGTEFIVKFPIK